MNKLLILVIIMLFNIVVTAQTNENGLSKKELRKKMEAMQDSISYANAVRAIENKDW